jgi:hypothetical protein
MLDARRYDLSRAHVEYLGHEVLCFVRHVADVLDVARAVARPKLRRRVVGVVGVEPEQSVEIVGIEEGEARMRDRAIVVHAAQYGGPTAARSAIGDRPLLDGAGGGDVLAEAG